MYYLFVGPPNKHQEEKDYVYITGPQMAKFLTSYENKLLLKKKKVTYPELFEMAQDEYKFTKKNNSWDLHFESTKDLTFFLLHLGK